MTFTWRETRSLMLGSFERMYIWMDTRGSRCMFLHHLRKKLYDMLIIFHTFKKLYLFHFIRFNSKGHISYPGNILSFFTYMKYERVIYRLSYVLFDSIVNKNPISRTPTSPYFSVESYMWVNLHDVYIQRTSCSDTNVSLLIMCVCNS